MEEESERSFTAISSYITMMEKQQSQKRHRKGSGSRNTSRGGCDTDSIEGDDGDFAWLEGIDDESLHELKNYDKSRNSEKFELSQTRKSFLALTSAATTAVRPTLIHTPPTQSEPPNIFVNRDGTAGKQ